MILLLLACSGGGSDSASSPASIPEVISALGHTVWIPRYEALVDESAQLSTDVHALCASPSAAALATARDRWWSAKGPWKQSDVLAVGPYTWWETRLGPAIDGWPADADWLDGIVTGADPIDDALLAGLGSTTTGFPALDWLLFADGSEVLASSHALEGPDGARRCALSVLLADQLHTDARAMVHAWSPDGDDVLGDFVAPTDESQDFQTEAAVQEEVYNRVLFIVQDLRETRLGKPLGVEDGGLPLPDTVEAPYSHRSLQDARDSLAGVRQHWTGAWGDGDDLGLVDRLPADRRDDLDQRFTAALDAADGALAAIPEPLSTAVVATPAYVQDARDALREVQVLLQVDIAQALQVTVQFNDNDGD